jgi:protein SCO1
MTEAKPPQSNLRRVRLLLWLLIALAIVGTGALVVVPRLSTYDNKAPEAAASTFGGPFTLIGSDGQPFSSAKLLGKPYAMYFGFTRCGDVCPTVLSRMVKLRNQASGADKFSIVFVTIDPAHDGPGQVGQYAGLFNSPIIGLTGSPAQIDHVKKEFGIYAQPSPHPMAGKEMEHSAAVLLFDRDGKFAATISPDEPDADALAKIKTLLG